VKDPVSLDPYQAPLGLLRIIQTAKTVLGVLDSASDESGVNRAMACYNASLDEVGRRVGESLSDELGLMCRPLGVASLGEVRVALSGLIGWASAAAGHLGEDKGMAIQFSDATLVADEDDSEQPADGPSSVTADGSAVSLIGGYL